MMDSNRLPGYLEASITAEEQQRRKLLQKKVQKIKLQQSKSKSPHWLKPKKYRNTDVQAVIEAHYKKRLAKYKETNTQLAHVVADQKLEIAHWYNESVTLKSETQSLQEKLLRYSNLQQDELIDSEVERRILERCASLNQAVNSSMSSFLEAVEGISKVKELVGAISKSSRRSKSIPSVSSPTPTVSEDNCSSESIMRSTDDETIENHRPSWQGATKLTHMWRQRQQDRFQAAETPDMSMIGEQSAILDDTQNISVADAPLNCVLSEVAELSQKEEDLDTSEASISEDLSYLTNENDVKSEDVNMYLLIQDSNIDDRTRKSTVPIIVEEIIPEIGGEADNLFEGSPCHLPKVKSARRSSLRSKRVSWAPIEGRGTTMESRGSKMRKSSILHLQLDLSSDFEEDNTENNLVAPKSDKKVLGANVSLSESICGSPRASPATMLHRLEELENKGGRKKRSRSKSLITSLMGDDLISSKTDKSSATGGIRLPEEEYNEDRLLMPPPFLSISPAPQVVKPPEPSFLIADNDLTMNEHLDMSMSDSVPNVIMFAKEDPINDINTEVIEDCKGVKKFFQNPPAQENSTTKEYNITLNKNTPYDVSLLEETGVSIIPFSSNKNYKENCPPTTHNRKSEKLVRRCSIILSDLLSPQNKVKIPQNLIISPEVRLSLCSPIEKVKSSVNQKKSLGDGQAKFNCEDSSPILDEEKEFCKTKDIQKNINILDDDLLITKDDEPPTKTSSKCRPSLSLKSKNRKSGNKQESEVTRSSGSRRHTQLLYIPQHLDSSVDISFSDDGDTSWKQTPLKKKKSLVKPRKGKSVGATRQSLIKTKIAEASENLDGLETQKKKGGNRSSRSKKSKLNEDLSAGDGVKPELTDNILKKEPEQTSTEPEQTSPEPEHISPEPEPSQTSGRQNQKKSRSSCSKKTKLHEDSSAGDCDKPELKDKTEQSSLELEPKPSLTTSERKSTENSKKRVEKRRQNTDCARKDSTSSSQASCISSDELPVLKSTNGTELNSESVVKKNKLICHDDDLVEDEKKCIEDAQSYQDIIKSPSVGEKRLVNVTEAVEIPRKKRAVCKNISFKEPSIHCKMRNDEAGNSKVKKSKSKAKKTTK